jgi:hypothetical protein
MKSHRVVLFMLPLLLQACVMVPRTVHKLDPECGTVQRRMELEPVQMGSIAGCSNEGCAVLLAAAGLATAASVVISGSIVMVGETVYWLERQGPNQPACVKPVPGAPAPYRGGVPVVPASRPMPAPPAIPQQAP